MTIQATRFTPEVLLSAPRRSAGIPNATGEFILYTVSTYSFASHTKTTQIRALNISDGSSHLISQDPAAYEPVWLSANEVAFLRPTDSGCTALVVQGVSEPCPVARNQNVIHSFTGSLSNLKLRPISDDRILFICSAPTKPNGELYWPSAEPKSYSSGKVYTSLFARHWDSWETENKNSLWFGVIVKANGNWTFESPALKNLLAGSRLSSPIPPFGGTGDFDISPYGVVFVAKDPDLNRARYTKTDLYYIPFKPGSEPLEPSAPQIVKTGKLRGYSLTPTFSKDGKKVAFARMKSDQYESDKQRLLLIPDVDDLSNVQEFYETQDGEGGWDRRPDWITWSNDDKTLYVGAEKHGHAVLWSLPSSPLLAREPPKPLIEKGSVLEAKTLGTGKDLFVSSRSLVESSSYSILDPVTGSNREVSSSSKHGKSLGLNESQTGEIWFPGSYGYDVHALVVKPSHFDETKKYPVAILIHGGPQGAWNDDWSTRWNPAIFAEQGYVTVCPNPTGSTGYGQAHTDAITENWGGNPYEDLVKCFEYLDKEIEYADMDRAVALGGSYGGYMINWIQGHDLGRKFKALVCHDGVFSTQDMWSSEELFFAEHEFGGTLWENRAGYEKWDPARHLDQWATPQLVIHGDLDYRLPMSEGTAPFNVLQARGVPSKLLVFPDENHWVLKPENSLVWHREVLGWINKYSGVTDKTTLASRTGRKPASQ